MKETSLMPAKEVDDPIESTQPNSATSRPIGRNEPCPCGSHKKYKRCCGVSAAPKLSQPKSSSGNALGDVPGLEDFDPQMITQMTQAFQKLPKGQLQRMQALMQKAMSGKDITKEAQELERSLPPDFQSLMQNYSQSTALSETTTEMVPETMSQNGSEEMVTIEQPKIAPESKLGRLWKSLSGKSKS